MTLITSKLDGSTYETREEFHKHLRKAKTKQIDYYTTHEPRVCRHTGQLIPFKDWEQYLEADFIDKESMQAWIQTNREEAKTYLVELISRRAKTKGMKFAPCDVELKSLGLPRAKYFETLPGYAELGLKRRYDYAAKPNIDTAVRPMVVDSREQLKIDFPLSIKAALRYGDYSLESDQSIVVERKSLPDFISSLTSGFERFEREMARAEEAGGYIVIMCESDIQSALAFDSIDSVRKFTKLKPQIVFHNVRLLLQRFECLQFLFCTGREEMKRLIPITLNISKELRHFDLQHLYLSGYL